MSTSDCLVSRYTVPRKLRGMDSCSRDRRGEKHVEQHNLAAMAMKQQVVQLGWRQLAARR
jgi:hypothetical protein